jgi:KDO2-lipid IV(A) lauroyltransferase
MEAPLHKRIKRFLRYLLIRAVFFCVGLLPLSIARRMGARLGGLGFHLVRSERRKALASLAVAFPDRSEAERLELARRCFSHLGESAAEFCCYKQLDSRVEDYVTLPDECRRLMERIRDEGKGCVFVSGHVGNFELVPRRMARMKWPCASIAKAPGDPHMKGFIEQIRTRAGYGIVWRGPGAFEHIESELRANHWIGFLIDQDTRGRGVFVDFFGKKAFTTRGAADLALKTGAAVVAGFVFRRPDGGHRLEIQRLTPTRSGDLEKDVLDLTQQLSDAIQAAILRDPPRWAWVHQRWKTQPAASQPCAAPAAGLPPTG